MLDNTYKITTDKITFHTPLVGRLVLLIISASIFAALCWCGTMMWAEQSALTREGGWVNITLILGFLFFGAVGLLVASSAFIPNGFLDLQKMSYEGFSYSLFSMRKITVPRQEMRSVIVLYSQKFNIHDIVIVCSRPINRLADIDNPDYANYIFLTSSRIRPEAEYLAQRVADCLNLPYFGIQDRRRG